MFALLMVFLLLFLALSVFFWVGTLFFQGYIYSEPVEGITWRAPAAGLSVTLCLAFWSFLDYRSLGRFQGLLEFSATEIEDFPSLLSVKRGQEIAYEGKTNAKGLLQYYDKQRGELWRRSDTEGVVEAIIAEGKDGQKYRFEAELTKDGKFKSDPVRYVEVGGRRRVMEDHSIGRLSTTRWGLIFGYLLLNLLHFMAWFLALWLLMQFQWSHAFGFAIILWLVMTFTIMPMLLGRTERVARDRSLQQNGPRPASAGL